jgi:transcriptional regulator with XRE-family HTH domain
MDGIKGRVTLSPEELPEVYAPIINDVVLTQRIKRLEKIHFNIDRLKEQMGLLENEADFLTRQIEEYEKGLELPAPSPAEVLSFRVEQSGHTQAYIARNTGVRPARLSEYLSGERNPSPKDALALSEFLGMPLEALLKRKTKRGT